MTITNSIVRLQPGIYVLRHPKGGLAPIGISRAPGTSESGKMASLSTANTHGSILRDGSDCIVLHISDGPVDLLVTAFVAREGDAVPTLRMDQIGLDAPAALAAPLAAPVVAAPQAQAAAPAAARPAPIEIGPHGISVIGHIERTGDVVAAPGDLLGVPDSGLRLEGFQVMWPDRPDGVDLAYGIALEGLGAMPVVKTGKFCGTKGEARRITEVTFALIGPRAGLFRLEGSAHFTGGFQQAIASGTPIGGPSGLEHLTAFRLNAVPAQGAAAHPAPLNPWTASERTTVFKPEAPTAPARQEKTAASKKPAVKPAAPKTAASKTAAAKTVAKTVAPKAKAASSKTQTKT